MASVRETNDWAHAPFDPAAAERLHGLIAGLDSNQRLWLSGYLAGSAALLAHAAPTAPATGTRAAVTILYGSHTGNAERVARLLQDKLKQRQIESTLLDMIDCRKSHLQDAQKLMVIVSTHGDGDPPERALPLYELLSGPRISRLDHLSYSVLALGDSSYEKFCETGRRFDTQLELLGAKRLHPCEYCDVEYEMPARRWIDEVLTFVGSQPAGEISPRNPGLEVRGATVSNAHTRRNPFHAPVLVNQRLTGRGSGKNVRHIEVSLEGSHIHYEPGDAIGVVPRNREDVVDTLLEVSCFDPLASVRIDSQSTDLRQALLESLDIGRVSAKFVQRYAAAIKSQSLSKVAESVDGLRRYVDGRHVVDVLREHAAAAMNPADFVQLLRPLAPRLYSIASSQRAVDDEAHLTVSVVEYESCNVHRYGIVSSFIENVGTNGATVPIYIHRNPGFRLPSDPRTPIVMVGPGTGVAPFRAFLAEREIMGGGGSNWLLFGDRNFDTDFLYQSEWLEARKRGTLTRIDVAFSRDQTEKIYVQDRLRENGAMLWAWLQEGAHLYLCGDAERMAPGVQTALLEIVRAHGALTDDAAAEYVLDMQRNRRYQKDVY
jgi:sulfite reductase (NADPH) flavoprotein alpha-component